MIKTSLIYLPSTILPRLGALLTVLIGAQLLTIEAFGYLSLITVIGEFADTALTNWTRIALPRFGATLEGVSRKFAIRMGVIAVGCTVFAVAVSVLSAKLLASEQAWRVAIAVGCYVTAASLVRYGITLNQIASKAGRATSFESARSIIALGASICAMFLFGDYLQVVLAGAVVNFAVGMFAIVSGLGATNSALSDRTDWTAVAHFAARLLLVAIFGQIIYSFDRMILKSFQNVATLGIYSAAYTIARNGFDVVANAFNIGGFIRLSGLHKEGRRAEVQDLLRRQLGFILAIALPAMAALFSARNVIALALFPSAYRPAFDVVVPFVAVGAVALNLKNFVYDNVFHLHMRNLMQLPPLVAGSFVGAITAIVLMPHWPLLGAAVTFMLSTLTVLAVTIELSRSLVPVFVPWRVIAVAAVLGLCTFGGSELIELALLGWSAHATLALQALLTLVAVTLSLALANSLLGTRNGVLGVAFVTSDPDRVTGLSSYSDSLIAELSCNAACGKLVVLTNTSSHVLPRARLNGGILWVQLPGKPRFLPYKGYLLVVHVLGAFLALRNGCGTYLSTTPFGSVVPVIEQFVTIHDLYDFDVRFRPVRTVLYAHLVWRWLAIVSRGVICVSDTTRSEVAAAIPFAKLRLFTIKEASKYQNEPPQAPDDPPYFLFVANVAPTKNFDCLISALRIAENEGKSIVVHWIGRDLVGIVSDISKREGMPKGLVALGAANEEELKKAYRRAISLVVPSWKEGFCLPVLEAHAMGVPVIASRIPVLQEVAGEGAIFFEPSSARDLLEKMLAMLSDPELRSELSVAAYSNAKRYSWERSAQETIELVAPRDNLSENAG